MWDSLQKGAQASATSDVVQRARRVIMRKMEALVKMFKSLVSDTLAIPVPELLIEQLWCCSNCLFQAWAASAARMSTVTTGLSRTRATPPRMSMCCLTCTSPSS